MTTIIEQSINRRFDALDKVRIEAPEELVELLPASDKNRIFQATRQSNGASSSSPFIYPRRFRSAEKGAFTRLSPSCSPAMLIGGLQSNFSEEDIKRCPYSGGFDGGSEISLFGSFYSGDETKRAELFAALRAAKERARNTGAGVHSSIVLGGRVWVVQASGASSKNQFNRFPFRLVSGGVSLLIADKLNKGFPSARLVYGYDALVGRRFLDVHNEVLRVLRASGFQYEREVVSRIDLQATAVLPFELIAAAFAEGRIVSRVRKWTRFDRQGSDGLTLGTLTGGHDVQICVYDKYRECIDKRNDDKLEDLYNLCEVVTNKLLRVEFRLRRVALRAMGLSSLQSIYERLPDLIQFLTSDWFRILKSQKVRGRENKQEVDLFWKRIQDIFKAVFCGNQKPKEVIKMRKKSRLSKKALTRQGFGCLVKAVASSTYMDSEPLKLEEFVEVFKTLFSSRLDKFYSDYLDAYEDLRRIRLAFYTDLTIPPEVGYSDSSLKELASVPLDDSELAIPWEE